MRYTNYFIGILLLLLAFRLYFFYQNISQYINGQKVSVTTTLLSQPVMRGNTQQFSIFLESNQRATVVLPLLPQVNYGDNVRISGIINRRVLLNKRVVMTIYYPNIEAVEKSQNVLLALASIIRQKITAIFHKSLPSPASNLLLGIVFGIKEDLPKDFFANLRATGVLHVIAASGMNITMIGGFLSSVFGLLFRRQIALFLAIGGILFYSLLSGLEPSIVRAAIMGSLAFGAQIFGRQYFAAYALLLSAYGMVMYSPQLLFDIGFQLSFSATCGLMYIGPMLTFVPKKLLIREDITTTIAAQIATMPILLTNFGVYSVISLVVNSLVLWTVPMLMIIGGAGATVGLVSEFLGGIILYMSIPLLFYFEYIVNLFGQVKWGISMDWFPWQWAVSYYCLLLAAVFYAQKSRSH